MTHMKQRGFTLVEIAIVLVIIGLLLGGILKGQELINSARVRNVADQVIGIQAAYYGFVDRYRAIPGDWGSGLASAAINGVATGGDNDGRIADATGQCAEVLAVWEHLSKAGFLTGRYNGGGTCPPGANTTDQAPRNAFNGFLAMSTNTDPTGQGTTAKLHLNTGNLIPINIARELDVKLDDGVASQGALRGIGTGTAPAGTYVQSDAACVANVGTPAVLTWNVASQSEDCAAAHLY